MGNNMEQMANHSIMLVDDNADFALLLQEAFAELQSQTSLVVVRDGTALARILGGNGEFAGEKLPDIVLLDLLLPGEDGFDILRNRKLSPVFNAIPIIVFTGSNNPADVDRSYALGANAFISRPAAFGDLVNVVQIIEKFWFTIVALPKN